MNTAKLVNSALTGGGLIYPENLNVIIGNEDKGYPKGYVLDANATLSLAGSAGNGSGQQNNSQQDEPFLKNLHTFNTNLKKGYQLSHGGQDSYNNNLIIGTIPKGEFNGNSIGYGDIIQGDTIVSVGNQNILTGPYIFSNSKNSHIISYRRAQTPTYTKVDDNNIIVEVDKNSSLYNLIKRSNILLYNTEVKNDKILINEGDNNQIKSFSYTVTDVDDKHIKLTSADLKKFIKNPTGKLPFFNIYSSGETDIINGYNIVNGGSICIMSGTDINVGKIFNSAAFGYGLEVSNSTEITVGSYNVSKALTGDDRYVFSVGAGTKDERKNALEVRRNGKVYIQDIGGFNGHNSDVAKTLQQVISDLQNNTSSTTQPVVDNGPWDVDITSKFVKGNVNISPSAMWTINQGYKRVYLETKLNQGDIIKIPNTIRMYIGWKDTSGQFGMANQAQAGTTYTATVDGDYVILLDTPSVNNPGIEPATLNSFGKVTLHTSNVAYRPNSGGSQPSGTTQTVVLPKDHTRDDKVMRGIAHQGYHVTERANSLAAFRAAAKEGWRYVETDTYMTSDGKFIVSHDPYLPTGWTNGTVTTTQGSYKYEEHTLAEILAFHGPNNEKTDTLEEFCKTCKECGLHPYIEIKQGKMADPNTLDTSNPRYSGKGYCIKILDIVNRCGLRGNATFIASVPYTLLLMARVDQSYRYGIVYFYQLKNSDANWTTVLSKIDEYNNDANASKAYLFLDANIDNLKVADADAVDTLALKNCALEVWTAKTKEDLDNLDPYVTGVTSDNIHAGEILAKKI